MYKTRSRSMQNGSHHYDRESIDLGELYKEHPPALTKEERAQFEFGAVNLKSFISRLSPVVRELSKAGFRKPKDVARLLNKKGIYTATGAPWTPRLAYFLLSLVFDGKVAREMQSGATLQIPKDIGAYKPSSSTPPKSSNRKASWSPKGTSALTTNEIANRLEALRRAKRTTTTK
jgi:hypothetical protein